LWDKYVILWIIILTFSKCFYFGEFNSTFKKNNAKKKSTMSCAITKDSYVIRILLSWSYIFNLTLIFTKHNYLLYAISYKISHGEKIRNWKRKSHFRFSKQSKWATFLFLFFTHLSNINKISHEENIQNWKRESHFRFRNKVSEHLFCLLFFTRVM